MRHVPPLVCIVLNFSGSRPMIASNEAWNSELWLNVLDKIIQLFDYITTVMYVHVHLFIHWTNIIFSNAENREHFKLKPSPACTIVVL